MSDLYADLNVSRSASPDEIKRAYRKGAKKNHPDRNPGDDVAATNLRAIQLAYDVLSDPDRRAKYNATGDTAAPKMSAEFQATFEILSQTLATVIAQCADMGRSPKMANLVDEMRKFLAGQKAELLKLIQAAERRLKVYRDAATRIEFQGGEQPDLLAVLGKQQVASIEAQIKQMQDKREQMSKAVEYLKAYKYRTDKGFTDLPWAFTAAY